MLKSIFLLCVCLFVCTRTVFSQWQFAVTTQGKIVFFDEQWTEVTTAAHQFEELLAITFDEIDERIYFNDHRHNKSSIFSLKLPLGKGNPHIIEDTIARTQNERVVAMDYDPLNRNIFWTDANNKKIYFYSIDADKGSKPKVLFDFGDEETTPDGISIDICRRKLYWTSSNLANPSVHRASLNGQDHEVLINSSLYFPHGITVDQLSDRIYYVVDQPGIHYTVESAKLDGTDRQILVKDINNMPFSLTVTRDSVYWTDLAHKAVWKIPKINSTDNHPIKVKSFDSPVRGIVSRLGILTRLKSDQGCKSVIQKIEQLMSTRNNQTGNRNKIEENNEMVCLGNGLYSEANSACACNAGYSGARCETYDCNNFCVHGTCKIEDGFPTCTCQIGFTGERCQTSKCSNFCLNDGHCTIEDNEPVCDCSSEMFGERCESNSTETCAPFCMLIRKDIEVDMPYYCYRVCRNLHPSDENIQRMKRPDELCRSSWNKSVIVIVCGVLVALLLIYLTILALRRIYKPLRPRIKKTIVLQKKISPTPLTCRPIATEQCEITIEDCCNSTVCETPCFDPKLLQKSMDDAKKQAKEDRAILIDNMENEIY